MPGKEMKYQRATRESWRTKEHKKTKVLSTGNDDPISFKEHQAEILIA